METGQQSLMPINKNSIRPILSFHVFNDGFFLSAFSESTYYQFEDLDPLTDKGFNNFIKANNLTQENESRIVFFDNPSMFVPSDLFEINDSKNYLSNYTNLKPNHEIIYETTDDNKIKIVYQKNNKVNLTFKNFFTKLHLTHYSRILYNDINKYIELNITSELNLFIHLQNNQFDMFLYKNDYLLIYNCFPHSKKDDFLYYLFALVEQYNLSANSFEITFLEKFDRFKNYYLALEDFHERINFIKNINTSKDNKFHPAPHFSNIL